MALPKTRRIPGWEPIFLRAIKNGYTEKNAANAAGVGRAEIDRHLRKEPSFKQNYEEALATKRKRPLGFLGV